MREYGAWVYVPCAILDEEYDEAGAPVVSNQIRCEVADWLDGEHEFTL